MDIKLLEKWVSSLVFVLFPFSRNLLQEREFFTSTHRLGNSLFLVHWLALQHNIAIITQPPSTSFLTKIGLVSVFYKGNQKFFYKICVGFACVMHSALYIEDLYNATIHYYFITLSIFLTR